eukprot:scaffold212_cov404-Prasinococcus_capsulatus_cf.AAC.16
MVAQLKYEHSVREKELSDRVSELTYSLDTITKSSEDRLCDEVERRRKVEREIEVLRSELSKVGRAAPG